MENEHVFAGLIRKRADIAGDIDAFSTPFVSSSQTCTRSTKPSASSIRTPSWQHHYPAKHVAFRGEMMRFVMDSLRTAQGRPVTTREIALAVARRRGLREGDTELLNTLRKRVGACIFKLKRDGVVRSRGRGTLSSGRFCSARLSTYEIDLRNQQGSSYVTNQLHTVL